MVVSSVVAKCERWCNELREYPLSDVQYYMGKFPTSNNPLTRQVKGQKIRLHLARLHQGELANSVLNQVKINADAEPE